jgi:energy-coupling factor transport system ATP-binding protein
MTIIMDHVCVTAKTSPTKEILKDINCTFENGTITLVIGKTGSGKTTLLDALAGLTTIKSGTVWFDKQPMWNKKRLIDAVRLKTGYVFQYPEHHLFARTVKGEFDYSLKPYRLSQEEDTARTISAMHTVNLALDLLVQSPLLLSSGQKRRVSLGSTFATQPEWLFLDEPTSGLDPEAVQTLITFFKSWKTQAKGGMVIATHDLDAFFPFADKVLVMHNGSLLANLTPDELCANTDILRQVEVGFPVAVEVAVLLNEQGISAPIGCVPAKTMATAITSLAIGTPSRAGQLQHHQQALTTSELDVSSLDEAPQLNKHVIHNLDPRAKWLFYILFSIGVFVQSSWASLLFASLIAVGIVTIAKVTFGDFKKILIPFAAFIVISVGLSGLVIVFKSAQLINIGFSLVNALITLQQLLKIFLIMILGILLPLTTSHMKIKKGLEQSLSWLPGMKHAAEAVALTAALMLRFIPMIMREVTRFSKIVRTRGKSRAKLGNIRIQDLHVVMIPLLLSVFQLADNLSLAMEARGYRKIGGTRTSCIQLKMNRNDTIAILIGVLLTLALFFIK